MNNITIPPSIYYQKRNISRYLEFYAHRSLIETSTPGKFLEKGTYDFSRV